MIRRLCAASAAFCILLSGNALAADASTVRLRDLTRLAQHLKGTIELTEEEALRFDVTRNGRIDLTDLVQLAEKFTEAAAENSPAPAAPSLLCRSVAVEKALCCVPAAGPTDVLSTELGWEKGLPRYTVKVRSSEALYTILVDGSSGAMLRLLMQRDPGSARPHASVTKEQAAQAVTIRVPGAAASDVTSVVADSGPPDVWTVSLTTENTDVLAKIVQATGEIVWWDEKALVSSPDPLPTGAPTDAQMRSHSDAVKIAVSQVPQATAQDVVSCTLDVNTLPATYTIGLETGAERHTIVIGAYDGAVLDDCMSRVPDPGFAGTGLTLNEAVRSVLEQVAGASASDAVAEHVMYMGVPAIEVRVDYRNVMYTAIFVEETGELVTWNVETLLTHAVIDPLQHQAPFPMPSRKAG